MAHFLINLFFVAVGALGLSVIAITLLRADGRL
jgi:hypothetical protein